jgi:hypothetical protein
MVRKKSVADLQGCDVDTTNFAAKATPANIKTRLKPDDGSPKFCYCSLQLPIVQASVCHLRGNTFSGISGWM